MGKIGFDDAFHDHEVGFVEGSFGVAAVVESQADMNIVETDFLIKVEIEDIEWNRQQHFDLF